MIRRTLAILLAAALLFTLAPAMALAAEDGAGNNEAMRHDTIILPGVGSIEDSIPLSELPGVFGLHPHYPVPYAEEYYRQQIDGLSAAIYDAMLAGELGQGPAPVPGGELCTVALDSLDEEDLSFASRDLMSETVSIESTMALAALVYDHPELSWLVNTECTFSRLWSGDGPYKLSGLQVGLSTKGYKQATTDYTSLDATDETRYGYANTENLEAINARINQAVTEIGDLDGQDDYVKAQAIHDWMCLNMQYALYGEGEPDFDTFHNDWRGFQTSYSALVSGTTVCAGYAKTFKILCDIYDIPCVVATGQANGGGHAWNYVCLEDKWYGVDVTWDDEKGDDFTHDYFMLGSSAFLGTARNRHNEGTLYGMYAYRYPTLATENYVYAPKNHSWDTSTWVQNAEEHWHACSDADCDARQDVAQHTWNAGAVTTLATEDQEGVKTFTCTVCGYSRTEPIPKLEHQHVAASTWGQSATEHWHPCTKPTCSEMLDVALHSWNEGDETTQATEDNEGVKTFTCTVCGYTKTEPIPKLEHQHVAASTWKQSATEHWHPCTKSTCTEKLSVGSHSWNEGVETTQATEDNEGMKTFTCNDCNYTRTEAIPKLEHKASETWTAGDETHWKLCVNDGCTQRMDEADHEFDEGTVSIEPTQTDPGAKVFTCTVCSHQITKTISPLSHEHQWSDAWKSDEFQHWHECTAEGCGTANNREDIGDHDWEWTVTDPATTKKPGTESGTCSVCGKTITRSIPQLEKHEHVWATKLTSNKTHHWYECTAEECDVTADSEKDSYAEHTWDGGTVTKAPTSTDKGERTYKCTAETCKGTRSEEIAALGNPQTTHDHRWATAWTWNNTHHWHACLESGCPVTIISQMSGYTTHTWDSGTVTTPATETAKGVRTFKCTAACGVTRTEEIPALGSTQTAHEHRWASDWASDSTHHWHVCLAANCPVTLPSQVNGYAAHVWDNAADTTCNVCGKVRTAAGLQISFDATGGTSSASVLTTNADGRLAYLPTASRAGYTFAGWFTSRDGGSQVSTSTVFTESATVFARWTSTAPADVPSVPVPSASVSAASASTIPTSAAPSSPVQATQPTTPSAQPSASATSPASSNGTPSAGPSQSVSQAPSAVASGTESAALQPVASAEVPFKVEQSPTSDVEGSIMTGIPLKGANNAPHATVAQLRASMNVPQGTTVSVLGADGTPADDTDRVRTGCVVVHRDANGNELSRTTVVMMGDVTGSGLNDLSQLVRIAQAYRGTAPLHGAYKLAALHTGHNDITLSDLVWQAKLYKQGRS